MLYADIFLNGDIYFNLRKIVDRDNIDTKILIYFNCFYVGMGVTIRPVYHCWLFDYIGTTTL